MDELSSLGAGVGTRYPLLYGPASYGRWQIQNYIRDEMSDREKAGLITQIFGWITSEEVRRSVGEELEKAKGKSGLQ